MARKPMWVLVTMVALLTCVACSGGTGATPTAPAAPPEDDPAVADDSPTQAPEDAPPVPDNAPTPTLEPPLAALVNGQPIYLAAFETAMAQYQADLEGQGVDPESDEGQEDLSHARSWILNVIIEQTLTEQAASEAGIVISDKEVDAYMSQMADEYGGQDGLEARLAEMGDTYDSAWAKARSGLIGMAMMEQISKRVPAITEHVHARHILVDTETEAQSLLNQVQGGADFIALAQAYSQDLSTQETGGDLGFFPRGILVAPEVEDVAFSLDAGEVSDVVTSALGYHILQVIEKDPEREVSPENLHLLRDQAVQKWIEEQWADAEIEIFIDTVS